MFAMIPNVNNLREGMRLRREHGLCFEYNDFFLPAVLEDKKEQLRLIDMYSKAGADFTVDTIHGAFLDVTVHSADPLIRQASERRVYQSMDIAKEMCARGVVFHTNRLYGFRDEAYLKGFVNSNVAFFTRVCEMYPDTKVYMENMWDEAYDVIGDLAERMKDVPNFSLCLDYGHAYLYGKAVQPVSWLEGLRPYIGHMHINDNDGLDDRHWALGEGSIDWKQFFKAYRDNAVKGNILIEVSGVDKLRRSLEFIETLQC